MPTDWSKFTVVEAAPAAAPAAGPVDWSQFSVVEQPDRSTYGTEEDRRAAKGRALRGEQMAERRSGYGASAILAGAEALGYAGDALSKADPLTIVPRLAWSVDQMGKATDQQQAFPLDSHTPIIPRETWTPEMAGEWLRTGGVSNERMAGIANAAGDFAEFFTTPMGISAMLSGKFGPEVAKRALAMGFTAQMAHDAPEAVGRATELAYDPNAPVSDTTRAVLGAATQVVLPATIIGGHAKFPRVPTPGETAGRMLADTVDNPAVARQLEEIAQQQALEATRPRSLNSQPSTLNRPSGMFTAEGRPWDDFKPVEKAVESPELRVESPPEAEQQRGPTIRGEAAMETRTPSPLDLQRERPVDPDLADAIQALREGYVPEVEKAVESPKGVSNSEFRIPNSELPPAPLSTSEVSEFNGLEQQRRAGTLDATGAARYRELEVRAGQGDFLAPQPKPADIGDQRAEVGAKLGEVKREIEWLTKSREAKLKKMGAMVPPPIRLEVAQKSAEAIEKLIKERDRLDSEWHRLNTLETKPAEVRPAEPGEQPKPPAQAAPAMQEGMDNLRFTSDPVKTAKAGGADAKDAKTKLIAELEKAVEQAKPAASYDLPVREWTGEPDLYWVREKMKEKGVPESQRRVTVEIPGDGTFTVWNVKEALEQLLSRAKRLETSTKPPKGYSESGVSKEDREWVEQMRSAQGKPFVDWQVNVNVPGTKNLVRTVSARTAFEAEQEAAALPGVTAVQKGTARQVESQPGNPDINTGALGESGMGGAKPAESVKGEREAKQAKEPWMQTADVFADANPSSKLKQDADFHADAVSGALKNQSRRKGQRWLAYEAMARSLETPDGRTYWDIIQSGKNELSPYEIHKQAVEEALKAGKPVPPEVLADYPDLKPSPTPNSQLPTPLSPAELIEFNGLEQARRAGTLDAPGAARYRELEVRAGQGDLLKAPEDLFAPPTPKAGNPDINTGALGESGMGGAKPAEFNKTSQMTTGIKLAAMEAQRAARGAEPLADAVRRSFSQETWQQAMARIDEDPMLPKNLLAELDAQPRALTDHDVAVLLYREADLTYERAKLSRDMAQAADDATQFPDRLADYNSMKIRAAEVADDMTRMEDVIRRSSSETGRGLAALRNMVRDNFTLAAMEFRERVSKGGDPLTDAERAKLVEQHARIEKLEAEAAAAEEKAAQERATRMTDEAIADMKRELASRPSYDPRIVKIAEEIVGKLERQAEKSRAFLKGKFLSPTPEDIYHLGVIGAAKIARLGLDFSKFSIEMAAEFGDGVKPYLQAAWDRANLHLENEGAKYGDKAEPVKRLLRKRDAAGRREGIVEGLKKAKEEGQPVGLLGDYVRKLALSFVRGGLTEREALVDAVHKVLTEDIGMELSRRETMDAISGYGRFKPLDMDAAKATLRDLKGQMQQLAKLEDITAKKPLQKTGVERRAQSDEERRLIQQVNEAKRRHGVVVTDPARQLKSALASRTTALKHRKADLEYQIATRERIVKTKTPTPFDAETKLLEVEVENLTRQLDELVPRPGITDEQRSAMAERSVEREIAVLEEQIKTGDVKAKAGRPIVSTAKLESLKARREALRAERQELRELDGEFQRQKAEKALTQQKAALEAGIAAREKALAEGPKPPVGREMSRPADPALESLMQQRDALNRQLAEARKKPWEQKHAEAVARQLAAMEQSIAQREAKLAAGDLSTEARAKVARPLADPELEMARQRLDDVNRRLAEARNPKKTPEERANAAAYTRLTNLAAQYADRLARGDFAPRVRKPVVMDAKALAAQAAAQRAKQAFQKGLALNRAANRTRTEKVLDATVAWNRFAILSALTVFEKLGSAAVYRMASTPVLEAIGSGFAKVLPGLAARAPRHGSGLNLGTEIRALTEGITAGMSDAAKMMRTGETDLDVLYGKFRDAAGTGETTKLPPTWLDFWGHLHGAMKTFPKRAEFTRSLEKNLAWEATQGADVTQPGVQMRASLRAYKDAERAIFMQDNRVVGAYKAALRWMDQKDKATGETPLRWQLAGTGARLALPIVKVPSNIAAEIFEHVFGVVTGAKGAAKAYRKGLENVGPEEADAVLRQLKNGSLGNALLLLGFYTGAQYLGGMHVHDEKRAKTDIKPNAGRVPGVEVPPWLGGPDIPKNAMHFPLISVAQMGATVARVSDSKLHKKDAETQGIGAGAIAAALGLAEEVPFMRESAMVANLREPNAGARYLGDKARSILVPQLAQWSARQIDSGPDWQTIRRDPKTAADHIKLGIPWMRNSVPEKVEKRGR